MVFQAAQFHLAPGVGEIDCCKLLFYKLILLMDSYIQFILSQCAQRMYLFKLLRHEGISSG